MIKDSFIVPTSRALTTEDYFERLANNKPIATLIARELEPLTDKGARRLANCGRYGIGSDPIELIEGQHGIYAKGVKWCGSRYCPTCQRRMMAALAWKLAQRAEAAVAANFGIASTRFSQPRGEDLCALVEAQRLAWKRWPRSSGVPRAWREAGLSGWLGFDYNNELDYLPESDTWHVHAHAEAFSREPFTPFGLSFLRSFWSAQENDSYSDLADCPAAAARYSVKFKKEDSKVMGLFDLAAAGMAEQVAQYLAATQDTRLRASSVALSKALGLKPAKEDEAALLALSEAPQGEVIGRFTEAEWRRKW